MSHILRSQSLDIQGQRATENAQRWRDTVMSAAEEEQVGAFSLFPLMHNLPDEEPDFATPSAPQNSPEVYHTYTLVKAIPCSRNLESTSSRSEEDCTSQAQAHQETPLLNELLDKKVAELVKFLSFKYRMQQPFTREEIMETVIKEQEAYFPEIFNKMCECMEVIFGIEVKKMNDNNHCYQLHKILDLTYDGMLSDQSLPKTGLLILILGVIFMEGNVATEEKVWDVLNMIGVYAEIKDFIYGEPRKLITQDLVKENYLVYRKVWDSDPPTYEFLWGPRAYAETTKMEVLQFFSKASGTVPTSFPSRYEEALRDEMERAQARIAALSGSDITRKEDFSSQSSSHSYSG